MCLMVADFVPQKSLKCLVKDQGLVYRLQPIRFRHLLSHQALFHVTVQCSQESVSAGCSRLIQTAMISLLM